MWMEAIPRVYGIDREQKTPAEPLSGKGFGDGPGPVGNPKGKKEVRVGVGELEGEGLGLAREGRGSQSKEEPGGCYPHGPLLGDMLPGQTLRMKRGVEGMTAIIPVESDEDDADLADDIYAFIHRTPLPWTQSRMMQVASVEFRGVDRDTL